MLVPVFARSLGQEIDPELRQARLAVSLSDANTVDTLADQSSLLRWMLLVLVFFIMPFNHFKN